MSHIPTVFPLSDFLVEEMQARSWTTDDVGKRMAGVGEIAVSCLEVGMILCVHDPKMVIPEPTLASLARAFGVDETFFQNLHAAYLDAPQANRATPVNAPDSVFGPIARWAIEEALSLPSSGRA